MRFLDREEERRRLDSLVGSSSGGLAVLWGRRRIGKTRLLLEWSAKHGGCYAVADQSAGPVQRRFVAQALTPAFPGLADVEYPDWRSLLAALARQARVEPKRGPIVLDELPYLVAADPSLPSALAAWLDHEAREAGLVVAVAGSTQHMMHGLVLDGGAPLYGRAAQLLRLGPLPPGYIGDALGLSDPVDQVRAWVAFGGVPRYWELAAPYGADVTSAVDALVLDPLGPLHLEPDRLLSLEMPPATSLRPILDVIGQGAHRLSEIGGRLGQSATSLSRPMQRLTELGLLRREVPYGLPERASKRSLYRIDDPFLRAWFTLVAPHRAMLATATPGARQRLWHRHAPHLGALGYEELCRMAVPRLHLGTSALAARGPFLPAGRLWEPGGHEWDVVAQSEAGDGLLLGEVKWTEREVDEAFVARAAADLIRKGTPRAAHLGALPAVHALFVPRLTAKARRARHAVPVIEARDLLTLLR